MSPSKYTYKTKKSLSHCIKNSQNNSETLSFGDERSFDEVGERVEWQMAHELRTTNWDRLKEMIDPEIKDLNHNRHFCRSKVDEKEKISSDIKESSRYFLSYFVTFSHLTNNSQ